MIDDPKPETYSTATGRTDVDESIFDDPPEGTDTPEPTTTPDSTPSPTPPKPEQPQPPVTTAPETTPQTPAVTPEKPVEPTPPAPADPEKPGTPTPTLYAGKFTSEQELRNAYQNLGGNPERFKEDVKGLEESYNYRQSEYTRIQQEKQERDRLATQIPDNNPVIPEDPSRTVDDLMSKVDWTKVDDAKDLGKELLKIFMETMPKNAPAPLTEAQLVERITPMIQEREQKQKALTYIEGKVPRLTKDDSFRRAYAYHIMAGRKDGTHYPRTQEGMDEAMKDFLQWGQTIAEESQRLNVTTTEQKKDALPPREAGDGIPSGKSADEVDEIIGSYAAKQKKFGQI